MKYEFMKNFRFFCTRLDAAIAATAQKTESKEMATTIMLTTADSILLFKFYDSVEFNVSVESSIPSVSVCRSLSYVKCISGCH